MPQIDQVRVHVIVPNRAQHKAIHFRLGSRRDRSCDPPAFGWIRSRIITEIRNIQYQVWRTRVQYKKALHGIRLCLDQDQIPRPGKGDHTGNRIAGDDRVNNDGMSMNRQWISCLCPYEEGKESKQ